MPGKQGIEDNGDANQWHWDEEKADLRAGEVLGEDRADLGADGCAGVHDESDEDVDIAFEGMAESSVTRGDDNFKQIRAHGQMGWDAEKIWRDTVANSATTKHFNSFLFGENLMPRLVRLGLISDRIAPKYREIGLL